MKISKKDRDPLLKLLQERFEKNPRRHVGIEWAAVQSRLDGAAEKLAEKLWSLSEMERTGGEPDVIGRDAKSGEILYCDCSAESPKERRSLCYDGEALAARKENKPQGSAQELAKEMGVAILTEAQYRELQTLGTFDLKTSSWIETPANIRKLGGALFCDRRYDTVFVYHNGAESYYAARAFRALLRL